MEKGKFSQNTTRFKDKAKNIQPVVIDTELVNSLIGDETNKAPSVAAVNDALDDKVNAQFFSNGKNRIYCARPNNPNSYYDIDSKPWLNCIPVYTNVESNIIPSASIYGQGTIVVVDPKHPFQSANKHYVDKKINELEHGMYNALGSQYIFESSTPDGPFIFINAGTLPIAYIERIGKASGYIQGEHTGDFDIERIEILDKDYQLLNSVEPTADQYITLPEGAAIIWFVSGADNLEVIVVDASIKFQVKVGV